MCDITFSLLTVLVGVNAAAADTEPCSFSRDAVTCHSVDKTRQDAVT